MNPKSIKAKDKYAKHLQSQIDSISLSIRKLGSKYSSIEVQIAMLEKQLTAINTLTAKKAIKENELKAILLALDELQLPTDKPIIPISGDTDPCAKEIKLETNISSDDELFATTRSWNKV